MIISLATTPNRINNFVYSIPNFYKELPSSCSLVLINVCQTYKRFNQKIKLNKQSLLILKKYSKFIINWVYDYGPISKYSGAIEYMKAKKINENLFIIDDDITYPKAYIEHIAISAPRNFICSGSGFKIFNGSYNPTPYEPDYFEGFSGIHFPYQNINNIVYLFSKYYKCLNPKENNNLINKYLLSCFMGDDFVLSKLYKKKFCMNHKLKDLAIRQYGLGADALQNNNLHGSNMGTYNYLEENEIIFWTFIKKIKVNASINKRIFHSRSLSF